MNTILIDTLDEHAYPCTSTISVYIERANMSTWIFLLLSNPIFTHEQIIDLRPPRGYRPICYTDSSFSSWVTHLELKPNNQISMYNDIIVEKGCFNQMAVVDMPLLFDTDIEQCADYCMRFWAEYHKANNTLDKLYLYTYEGRKRNLGDSGKSYQLFLRSVFQSANSYSLKEGCFSVNPDELKPGDMFVQNSTGGIGHVSMIVSMCESEIDSSQLFLIGFSFMPAQEFHIERAPEEYGIDGWFTFGGAVQYLETLFGVPPVLRRF